MTDEVTEHPTKLNALPDETRQEKREKLKARKVFAAVFSPFVKAMTGAMETYLRYRREGVSRPDAIAGLEVVLRDVWPKHVSKFKPSCDLCDDTGYQDYICRPYVRCGSKHCERKGEEHQHKYVQPCECAKGQGFARAASRKGNPEVEVETIGKVNKPKRGGWRQLGS